MEGLAVYSTLKPDTSSDSPCVKSKGPRLVSAGVEGHRIIANGHEGNNSHSCSCVVVGVDRGKEPLMRSTDRRMMASVASYGIVCATAWTAPISAYFELEAQRDHRIE